MKLIWLLMVGLLLPSNLLLAQEQFVNWLDKECFVVQRTTAEGEQAVKICLPSGKESIYRANEADLKRNNVGSVTLDNGKMVHAFDQDLYLISPNGDEIQLTNDPAPELNFTLSPDQSKLAYTKNRDLHVVNLSSGNETRLTTDASSTLYNGWSSWVYYEEILGRPSNYKAFWWNPLGTAIAFLQFDDTPVPSFPIYHAKGVRGDLEVMRYPKAGDENPRVRMGVVDLTSGQMTWMQEDSEKDQYTAWPNWTPDGRHLIYQELNRDQDTLCFIKADPNTGIRTVLNHICRPTWVEFIEEVHFINDHTFLFLSDHEGWNNIYQVDINTGMLNAITRLSYNILTIDNVNPISGEVFFYAHGEDPRDRHYYRMQLTTGKVQVLTKRPGWHQAIRSADNAYLLDRYTLVDQAAKEQILDMSSGSVVYELDQDEETQSLSIEPFTISTDDGFNLPGYLVFPKGFSLSKQYPVVFTLYGGPDRQEVTHQYRDLSHGFYTNNEIIQVKVDHRGSGIFGRRGLDYLYRSLGQWEIKDLTKVVEWLRAKPFVDPKKIGITGGSYGGYLTSLALTLGSDYFTHGVSLYPVTDWTLYDNVYTERYMDEPRDNPNGYKAGSAITHSHLYKGSLLIVHGSVDDNVHLQNTLQFVSVMQDLGKSFEMMIYPGERHGWVGPKRSHLVNLTQKFWKKYF
ncbi:MAG: prolyl oligopeptidase family serine peptidase [Saprospiraceae bacterium]|nr:prolyl oligopeptidase family serine peptidase [Saprospiraceae bacterium]